MRARLLWRTDLLPFLLGREGKAEEEEEEEKEERGAAAVMRNSTHSHMDGFSHQNQMCLGPSVSPQGDKAWKGGCGFVKALWCLGCRGSLRTGWGRDPAAGNALAFLDRKSVV